MRKRLWLVELIICLCVASFMLLAIEITGAKAILLTTESRLQTEGLLEVQNIIIDWQNGNLVEADLEENGWNHTEEGYKKAFEEGELTINFYTDSIDYINILLTFNNKVLIDIKASKP